MIVVNTFFIALGIIYSLSTWIGGFSVTFYVTIFLLVCFFPTYIKQQEILYERVSGFCLQLA